jgi:hypothetical protein
VFAWFARLLDLAELRSNELSPLALSEANEEYEVNEESNHHVTPQTKKGTAGRTGTAQR